MNIHFSDVSLFQGLMDATITQVEFGSVLYGTKGEDSDTDYLCIYAPSDTQEKSFLWDHHNLQFKTTDCDYIFITLDDFIRNTINGDMPVLLEVLHNKELACTPLSWLYNRRHWFYTYQNIKSYLGYAKRDLKYAMRDRKRLCHVYRGINAAKQLMGGHYVNPIDQRHKDQVNYLNRLRYGDISHDETAMLCREWTEECQSLRNKINDLLHNKKVTHTLAIEHSRELDQWLTTLKETSWYCELKEKNPINIEHLTPFYSALEEGIKY